MAVTVCFDALGTCFSMEPLIEALDELMGEKLRQAGSGSRMVLMDWFHAAQRDFTYLSITSPPPPPIAHVLKLTLGRSLMFALHQQTPSLTVDPLPDLSPVLDKLTSLTPSPGLEKCWELIKASDEKARVLVITNGAKATTEGYIQKAGLSKLVDSVQSCDQVGLAKPFAQVYKMALEACDKVESGTKGDRWFVACHMWDLAAASKAGFKTAVVTSEQPPLGQTADGKDTLQAWYDMYGVKPEVSGRDLEELARGILAFKSG